MRDKDERGDKGGVGGGGSKGVGGCYVSRYCLYWGCGEPLHLPVMSLSEWASAAHAGWGLYDVDSRDR